MIQEGVREGDIVARIGGEEFAVILPATTATDAAAVAERIRGTLEKVVATNTDSDLPAPLTMSFGVFGTSEKALKASAWFEFANMALYEAKRGGRNRVVLYTENQ